MLQSPQRWTWTLKFGSGLLDEADEISLQFPSDYNSPSAQESLVLCVLSPRTQLKRPMSHYTVISAASLFPAVTLCRFVILRAIKTAETFFFSYSMLLYAEEEEGLLTHFRRDCC